MSQHKLTITVDDGDSGVEHSLSGIPSTAWERFRENAKAHFPKSGDDAWASFLSEVILSVSGGDASVTYFMTDVPRENAEALDAILKQMGFTWDKFHAYLLRSALKEAHTRVIRLVEPNGDIPYGVFIATGLKPELFAKIEQATGKSFEIVLGSILLAAQEGTLQFSPESTFVEPTPVN